MVAAVLGGFWVAIGPGHPVFAVVAATWTLLLGALVGEPLTRRTPDGWLRVPPAERIWHRRLGVARFDRLLDRIRWNRVVARMRSYDGTRAALPALDRAVRESLVAHAAGFAVHAGLTVAAAAAGYGWGALWLLLGGLAVHAWPALLQRSLRLRLQPLLLRTG